MARTTPRSPNAGQEPWKSLVNAAMAGLAEPDACSEYEVATELRRNPTARVATIGGIWISSIRITLARPTTMPSPAPTSRPSGTCASLPAKNEAVR